MRKENKVHTYHYVYSYVNSYGSRTSVDGISEIPGGISSPDDYDALKILLSANVKDRENIDNVDLIVTSLSLVGCGSNHV